MGRTIVAAFHVIVLLLLRFDVASAQVCTVDEERSARQLLSLADTYMEARTWDKAADTYARVALSPCDELALEARRGLTEALTVQSDPSTLIRAELNRLMVTTATGLVNAVRLIAITLAALGIVVLLVRTLLDRAGQDRWIVLPMLDLTGNKLGDSIAELVSNKIHEIRILHGEQASVTMGLSENIDLPSFSAGSQKETLLKALGGLDSLDVGGIGLPFGSAISSIMRWVDLSAHRISGTIQRNGASVELSARLEEGRRGKCSHVWRLTEPLSEGQVVADALPVLVDRLAYRIIFDLMPSNWGTRSVLALKLCTEGLSSLQTYYRSNSQDKAALHDAAQKLLEANRIDPTYQLAIFNLALVRLSQGDSDGAIPLLRDLADTSNHELKVATQYNLGVAYYNKTIDWAYDIAEKAFDSVLSTQQPRETDEQTGTELAALAHCGLISIIAQRARHETFDREMLMTRAIAHHESALTLAAGNEEILAQADYSLGVLHLNWREFDRARSLLTAALKRNPYHWKAYTALGQVEIALDQVEKAVSALEKATALAPDFEFAQYQLGRALSSSDIPDRTERALVAFSRAPSISSAHIEKGRILALKLNDHAGAIACFERAIELNSRSADAYAELAWYLAESGPDGPDEKNRAAAAARRAVELTSRKDWHKLAVLGKVLYSCEEYEEARRILSESLELNPEAPQVHYHLACVESACGNYPETRDRLIAFLQLPEQGVWRQDAVSLMKETENNLRKSPG